MSALSLRARAALWYADELTWPVLPLYHVRADGSCTCQQGAACRSAGKHPQIGAWQEVTCPDLEQVRLWWRLWPQANVGVVLGAGHVVLDVDPRNGGDEALAELERAYGELPLTPAVLTGGGGVHYHFAAPADIPTVTIAPGVEFKARGAQVVLPPSRSAAGEYRWDAGAHIADLPLAPLPAWLSALARQRERSIAPTLPQVITAGERNRWLTSLAGSLRRRGCTEHEILACLHVLNDSRCCPPLKEQELAKIARSITRYAPAYPAVPAPGRRRVIRLEVPHAH